MLGATTDIVVGTTVETTLVSVAGDGTKKVAGFVAHGTWSARFNLYIDTTRYYTYITSPENRTGFVADIDFTLGAGSTAFLKVLQLSGTTTQQFGGSILGST
jgi:hypothetical protein